MARLTQSVIYRAEDNRLFASIPKSIFESLGGRDGIRQVHRVAFGGSDPAAGDLFEEYYVVELVPKDKQPPQKVFEQFDDALSGTLLRRSPGDGPAVPWRLYSETAQNIVVYRDDEGRYIAYADGGQPLAGGDSFINAIGRLVCANPERFNIQINPGTGVTEVDMRCKEQ